MLELSLVNGMTAAQHAIEVEWRMRHRMHLEKGLHTLLTVKVVPRYPTTVRRVSAAVVYIFSPHEAYGLPRLLFDLTCSQ